MCEDPDTEEQQARDDQVKDELASPSHSDRPATLGLGVFSWSGKTGELNKATTHTASIATDRLASKSTPSGLSSLQQFQRKKGSFSWKGSGKRSLSSSPVEGTKDSETSPDSPPSQDSAYFSQSSIASTSVEEDINDRVRKCA